MRTFLYQRFLISLLLILAVVAPFQARSNKNKSWDFELIHCSVCGMYHMEPHCKPRRQELPKCRHGVIRLYCEEPECRSGQQRTQPALTTTKQRPALQSQSGEKTPVPTGKNDGQPEPAMAEPHPGTAKPQTEEAQQFEDQALRFLEGDLDWDDFSKIWQDRNDSATVAEAGKPAAPEDSALEDDSVRAESQEEKESFQLRAISILASDMPPAEKQKALEALKLEQFAALNDADKLYVREATELTNQLKPGRIRTLDWEVVKIGDKILDYVPLISTKKSISNALLHLRNGDPGKAYREIVLMMYGPLGTFTGHVMDIVGEPEYHEVHPLEPRTYPAGRGYDPENFIYFTDDRGDVVKVPKSEYERYYKAISEERYKQTLPESD